MKTCCRTECKKYSDKALGFPDAEKATVLELLVRANIKKYIPSAQKVLSSVELHIITTDLLESADIRPINCPECGHKNALIYYSSRFLLMIWELQLLLFGHIDSWNEKDGTTTIRYRQMDAASLKRYNEIYRFYMGGKRELSYNLDSLLANLFHLSGIAQKQFSDHIHIGQLWILLHEMSHYLTDMVDLGHKDIRTIVEDYMKKLEVSANEWDFFQKEFEADLLATYLLIVYYGEQLAKDCLTDIPCHYTLFSNIACGITTTFPALNMLELGQTSTNTHPSSALRIFLIYEFLKAMYPNKDKTEFFSMANLICTISKDFSVTDF